MKKYERERDSSVAKVVRVVLWKSGERIRGTVRGPLLSDQSGHANQEIIGSNGELSPEAALAVAERLSAQYVCPLVVRDDDDLWQHEWGELM
jgi:hypothetical protein